MDIHGCYSLDISKDIHADILGTKSLPMDIHVCYSVDISKDIHA